MTESARHVAVARNLDALLTAHDLGRSELADRLGLEHADEARVKAERSFRAALAQAQASEELEGAVGPLGVVLRLHDHGWIAICYADTHRYPGFSLAIAVDSQSRWYTSSRHYCGTFAQYREWKGGERDELPTWWEYFECLRGIEASPDVEVARSILLGMGFTEAADPSPVPPV